MTIAITERTATVLRREAVEGVQNLHHWPFRRNFFNATDLGRRFRGCSCAQSVADMVIHGAQNDIAPQPWRLKEREMDAFVERHRESECGCWREDQVTVVNLLSPHGHGPTLNLPCEWVWVDRLILQDYILPRYRYSRNLPRSWSSKILARHTAGKCACSVAWSAGAVMSLTSPDELALTG